MNNGSAVAHYTGEGSRAVLYVKTWTVERPSGRCRTIAFSPRGKSSSSSEKGGTSGICVVLGVFCQARKYLPDTFDANPNTQMCLRLACCQFVYTRYIEQNSCSHTTTVIPVRLFFACQVCV